MKRAREVEAMEWQRIGRASFRQRMALVASGAGVFWVFFTTQFVLLPLAGLAVDDGTRAAGGAPAFGANPFLSRLLLGLTSAVVAVIVVAVAARFHPGLEATSDGDRVRIGRRELPASALQHAWLGFETQGTNREQLILRLEAGRRRTRLWLRAKERVLLTRDERALLVRVLEHSSVAPPTSAYDPTGRFARYNFPGSLTKQEAIELVRNVPAPGARLPVTD